MTPKQYLEKAEIENLLLVDIRRSEERKNGQFLEGSLHLPMEEILLADTIELPLDTKLVILCQRGGRADLVISNLRAKGFSQVEKLEGGWVELAKYV